MISLVPEDMQGFMEVLNNLPADKGLDIIMHSPGGSAEAVEALITFVRATFNDVRVIVPHAAMSAATMFGCAANTLVMGTHSFLGPIDPQFIMMTENGRAAVPAHAILAQFELAKKECASPGLLPAWIPMLKQYGPALLVQCQLAQDLAKSLVEDWLARYMFAGHADRTAKAASVAAELANHANFKSHGRFIGRDQARSLGLIVEDLEAKSHVENAVLGTFHATTHTFAATGAVKIIENHKGKAYIKAQQMIQMVNPGAKPGPPPAIPTPSPLPPKP